MSFADLETRANAAAMRRLANARASIVGVPDDDFPVIFDQAAVETGAGATARMPVVDVLDSDIAGAAAHDTQLLIAGATYTVIDIQPDGTGMSKLVLELVQRAA